MLDVGRCGSHVRVPVASRLWDSRPVASSLNFKTSILSPHTGCCSFHVLAFRSGLRSRTHLDLFSFTFNIQLVCKLTEGIQLSLEPLQQPLLGRYYWLFIFAHELFIQLTVVTFSFPVIFTYATAASSIWASFCKNSSPQHWSVWILLTAHWVLSFTEETLSFPMALCLHCFPDPFRVSAVSKPHWTTFNS